MNALTLLKALVALVTSVANYLKDKQLIEAGAAHAVLNGLRDANDAIALANNARQHYDSLPVESDQENRDNRK